MIYFLLFNCKMIKLPYDIHVEIFLLVKTSDQRRLLEVCKKFSYLKSLIKVVKDSKVRDYNQELCRDQYFHLIAKDYHRELILEFAYYGAVDLLKTLNLVGYEQYIVRKAAEGSQFEVLKWAVDQHYRIDDYVMNTLAENGQLPILKWLYKNGCHLHNHYICSSAAKNGHLHVLKWLRKHNAPWGNACSNAAEYGHLDVLIWLRENLCPWDKWTLKFAIKRGHLDVVAWATQNGCPL